MNKLDLIEKELEVLFKVSKKVCAKCRSCCCNDCGGFNAYFGQGRFYLKRDSQAFKLPEISLRRRLLLKIQYDFSKKQGFLDKKKGCRLPYRERSLTCIGYNCHRWFCEQRDIEKKVKPLIRRLVAARRFV